MLSFLNSIQVFWSKKSLPSTRGQHGASIAHTDSPDKIWNSIEEEGPVWQSEEIAMLLEHEHRRPTCLVYLRSQDSVYQTILLGFDLSSNHLLVDEFFPSPSVERLLQQPMRLRLRSTAGELDLTIVLQERISLQGGRAYMARVLAKELHTGQSKRLSIGFSQALAPSVQLLLPMGPTLKGTLLELSSERFVMRAYGPRKPVVNTPTGECTIYFNQHFTLNTRVTVKNVSFHRKPCCHTEIRAAFRALNEDQGNQLSSFIQSMHDNAHTHHQAA